MDWQTKAKTIVNETIRLIALVGWLYILRLNIINPQTVVDPLIHGMLLMVVSGVDVLKLAKALPLFTKK